MNIERLVSEPIMISLFQDEKKNDSNASSSSASSVSSTMEDTMLNSSPKLPSFKELFASTVANSSSSSTSQPNDLNSSHSSSTVNLISKTESSTSLTTYVHRFRPLKDSNSSVSLPSSPRDFSTSQESSISPRTSFSDTLQNSLKDMGFSSLNQSAPHIKPLNEDPPFSSHESSTNNNALPSHVNFLSNHRKEGELFSNARPPRSSSSPRKSQSVKGTRSLSGPLVNNPHLLKKMGGSDSNLALLPKKAFKFNQGVSAAKIKKPEPLIYNTSLMSIATGLLLENTMANQWKPVKIDHYSPQIHIYNHSNRLHHINVIHDRNQIYIRKEFNADSKIGQILIRLIINLNIQHFVYETDATTWYPAQWNILKAIYLLPEDYKEKIISMFPTEVKSLSFQRPNEKKIPSSIEWKVPSPRPIQTSLSKPTNTNEYSSDDSLLTRPRSESAPVLYQEDDDVEWSMHDQ